MIERCENLHFPLKARHAAGVAGKDLRQQFDGATSRPSLLSVARQTSPIPPSPILDVVRQWATVRCGITRSSGSWLRYYTWFKIGVPARLGQQRATLPGIGRSILTT